MFALVKCVARVRRDLKLVIVLSESGSTSDPEKLSDYFDKAPIIRIPHKAVSLFLKINTHYFLCVFEIMSLIFSSF